MNEYTIQKELERRTALRISDTVNGAMSSFRILLAEIDCMSDDEIEAFQNALMNYAARYGTNRRKAFTANVHDATIQFLTHNRV